MLHLSDRSLRPRSRSRFPSPRPPTPPRRRQSPSSPTTRDKFIMSSTGPSHAASSSSLSAIATTQQQQQQPTQQANSMLDLSYLSAYELDGATLADTASVGNGSGSTHAAPNGVDVDLVTSETEPGPLPTPTPQLSIDQGASGNGTPAEGTPKRRNTRPSRPAAQPERRFRHTPHLPSGHAPRVAPTTMYWSRAPVHGLLPLRKFRAHSATLVDGHEAWVFGGCDETGCSKDVYILDTETFQWSLPDLVGDAPPPCRAHTATLVDGKRIFVFGGGAASEYYDGLWVLDTQLRRWSHIELQGIKPTQRRAHTAVLYKGRIIVFGGGNGTKALNDVWALDTQSMLWEQLETQGRRPNARGYHTANVVGNNMVVVGGSDGRTCFPDIWVLNLDTLTWRLVETERTYRRLSHTAVQVGSYLFVMGGHDSVKYSNELLLFNLITLQWELRTVAGRPPSARAYQTALLTDSRLFLMGGFDGSSTFDDVHLLDLAASAYLPQVTSFSMV